MTINEPFNYYANHIKSKNGGRLQKISIIAGFTCPNRDGVKGIGGCTYCNNDSFSAPKETGALSITDQLNRAIELSKRRYKKVKGYIAYFQSYSNTYAPLEQLKELYEEALAHPDIVGLSIGTRPDCVDKEKLDYLETLAKDYHITLEYGLESIYDETLEKINRCSTFEDFSNAMELSKDRGINLCVHIILGFPWETKQQMIAEARVLSNYPIDYLKIHQLHIVDKTILGAQYKKENFKLLTREEYKDILINFIENLNPKITIQRVFGEAPKDLLLSPSFKIRMPEFTNDIIDTMKQNGQFQGKAKGLTYEQAFDQFY